VTVTTRASYRSLVEVAGETAVIVCENGMTVEHPVDVVLRRKGRVVEQEQVSNDDGYSLMVDSFSEAIHGDGQFLATGEDGLHNQHVLDAAYRSWRTGERQTLPSAPAIR
jgi:predicted dehydrogenase